MADERYVFDEAVHSGAVRTDLRGNQGVAQSYLPQARRMLGAMRTVHGVNDRIAAGQPSGFFRQSKLMPDGSLIEITHNDGQDMIRVDARRSTQGNSHASDARGQALEVTATVQNEQTQHAAPIDYPPDDVILRDDDEDEKKKTPEIGDVWPFLWVGVRFIDPEKVITTFPATLENPVNITVKAAEGIKLHLCLWLPPEKNADPVILSNRSHIGGGKISQDVYPLQDPPHFLPLINDDYEPNGMAYTGSRAGEKTDALRAYQISLPNHYATNSLPDGATTIAPDDDQKTGKKWQEVVIVDPYDAMALGLDSGEMTGQYFVKVMASYSDCPPIEPFDVEIRVIACKTSGTAIASLDRTFTFTIHETTSYMMGIMPLGWHQTAIDAANGQTRTDPPLGRRLCSENPIDDGENPHGMHWWQGGVTIFMPLMQMNVPLDEIILPTIAFYDEDHDADVKEKLIPDYGFSPANFPSKEAICVYCTKTVETVSIKVFKNIFALLHVDSQGFGSYNPGYFYSKVDTTGWPDFDATNLPHSAVFHNGNKSISVDASGWERGGGPLDASYYSDHPDFNFTSQPFVGYAATASITTNYDIQGKPSFGAWTWEP